MQKTSSGMNLGKLFTFSIIPNATEKKKTTFIYLSDCWSKENEIFSI